MIKQQLFLSIPTGSTWILFVGSHANIKMHFFAITEKKNMA